MKVINKHPYYIKDSDRMKSMNHAYTVVFLAINKMEANHMIKGNVFVKKTV